MALKYSVKNNGLERIGLNVLEEPQQVLEVLVGAGYDGIEIKGEPDRIDSRLAGEIADAATSRGVKVSAVGGAWGAWDAGEERDLGSSEDAVRRHALGYAEKCINLAADLKAPIFEICAAPFFQEYPFSSVPLETSKQNFIQAVSGLCQYAADHNVAIAIEPINRFEGYPGFLNSVDDAMIVIDEIASDNLGVLLDFFHANIEDASIPGAIRMAGSRLMNIHLSDSNRDAPGTGHIDFIAAIKALVKVEYEGYISMGFLPSRLNLPKLREALLEKSIGYMREQEGVAVSEKKEGNYAK